MVDTPPGNERLLAKAIEQASIVVIPTRVGGVETPRVEAVLDLVPTKVPVGLAICSARTYTRDYQDMVAAWVEAGVPVWGSVPERVNIASGPEGWLSPDGLESYREIWRRRPPRLSVAVPIRVAFCDAVRSKTCPSCPGPANQAAPYFTS